MTLNERIEDDCLLIESALVQLKACKFTGNKTEIIKQSQLIRRSIMRIEIALFDNEMETICKKVKKLIMRFTKGQNDAIKQNAQLILNEAVSILISPDRLAENEMNKCLLNIDSALLRIRAEIQDCDLIDREIEELKNKL